MSMAGKVAEIVLKVLGHNVTCPNTARRHVEAIDQLLGLEISPATKQELEARKQQILARWGGRNENGTTRLETNEKSPAVWLGKRRDREKAFYSLKGASKALLEGETRLTRIMLLGLGEGSHIVTGPVRLDTFKYWLLRTGVATHEARGRYVAGPNAERLSKMEWNDMLEDIDSASA